MAKVRKRPQLATHTVKRLGGRARARTISTKRRDGAAPFMHLVTKAGVSLQGADVFADINLGDDNAAEYSVIEPEYGYKSLLEAAKRNSALNQCIDAYVVNVESYGYQLEYIGSEGKEGKGPAQAQRNLALSFLDNCGSDKSLRATRENSRRDKEYLGDRYFEVGLDEIGRPTFIEHVPTISLRKTKKDKKATAYTVKVRTPDGKIEERQKSKNFCRYVQVSNNGNKVYFKELDDPRPIDPKTGKVNPALDIENQATAIWADTLYSPGSRYGVPRWIGALPDMLGLRESEMVNLNFFRENAIPAMALLISGGALTEESFDKVEKIVNAAKGKDAMNRIMILEAASDDSVGTTDSAPPAPKIELKMLAGDRQNDGDWSQYQNSAKRKIRSSMRLPALYTGDCYSEDTEFLTEDGWRSFDNVIDTMKLATYNLTTGEIEYQLPTKRHVYDYDDEMVRIKSKCVDALVTPRHRLVHRNYRIPSRKPAEWECHTAETLETWRGAMDNALEVPTSGHFVGKKVTGIFDRDAEIFAKFLGYFISEGSLGTSTQIRLHQNEGWIADDMRSVLNGMYVAWSESTSRGNQVTFTISDSDLRQWLIANVGSHSYNKRIPRNMFTMDDTVIDALITAMYLGDGSSDTCGKDGSFTYSTTSKQLADDLQELLTTRKMTVSVREHDYHDGVRKRSYRLYCSNSQTRIVRPDKHISREWYKGRIVCFTVPNQTLVTRRNGKVLLAQNTEEYTKATAQSGIRIAESQVFAPEREVFDEFVNNRLLPRLGVTMWSFKSLGPPVYDPDSLSTMIDRFGRHGAMTPNILIKIANKVLDVQIPSVTDKWGDIPFTYTMGMVNSGMQIEGFEEIFATINDATTTEDDEDDDGAAVPANDNTQSGRNVAAMRRVIRKELTAMTDDLIARIQEADAA